MGITNIKVTNGQDGAGGQGALLVLLNPDRTTRPGLLGIMEGARKAGIRTEAVELGQVWDVVRSGRQSDAAGFARALSEKNVRAVIGYALNGLMEWPAQGLLTGAVRPFFEQVGIPHLMWWPDHPQRTMEKTALARDKQTMLSAPHHHHLVKSGLAADELRGLLGWTNCHGMPLAEDPDRLRPVETRDPDFDVVIIADSPSKLDDQLERFLADDDPDVGAINDIVARGVLEKLKALWTDQAPKSLRAELEALGCAWIEQRCDDPQRGCFRIFSALERSFPSATAWMRANPLVYFNALEALWDFGRGQQAFLACYLARHLKVGVFGDDESGVGMPGGHVDYDDQPDAYARGRVAIADSCCQDEEGIGRQPFLLAACRVPMMHGNRKELDRCFRPGEEVETFDTPREALEKVQALLDAPERAATLAQSAHQRLCRDHTWAVRVPQWLTKAGIDVSEAFGIKPPTASSPSLLKSSVSELADTPQPIRALERPLRTAL